MRGLFIHTSTVLLRAVLSAGPGPACAHQQPAVHIFWLNVGPPLVSFSRETKGTCSPFSETPILRSTKAFLLARLQPLLLRSFFVGKFDSISVSKLPVGPSQSKGTLSHIWVCFFLGYTCYCGLKGKTKRTPLVWVYRLVFWVSCCYVPLCSTRLGTVYL